MDPEIGSVVIRGKEYVPKEDLAKTMEGMNYVIIRAKEAGVFAGSLKNRNKDEVVLLQARRIYYWDGAATLSQLAMEGVSKPQNCKFPQEISTDITILGVIEVISCTEKARISIKKVQAWRN